MVQSILRSSPVICKAHLWKDETLHIVIDSIARYRSPLGLESPETACIPFASTDISTARVAEILGTAASRTSASQECSRLPSFRHTPQERVSVERFPRVQSGVDDVQPSVDYLNMNACKRIENENSYSLALDDCAALQAMRNSRPERPPSS